MGKQTETEIEDYHQTKTYKAMDGKTKKLLARYKRENDVSNDQLFCQLYLADLESAPKEERKGVSRAGVVLLVLAIVLFAASVVISVLMESVVCAIIGAAVLVLVIILFLCGVFNPYKKTRRRTRRRMSKLPQVISFEDWRKALDEDEDVPASHRHRRR